MDEESLIKEIQKDKSRFSELYNLYYKEVWKFAYTIVQDEHIADDIVSKAFLTLFKKIGSFKWTGISSKYWLFKAVKNISGDYFKKEKKLEPLLEEGVLEDQSISFTEEIIQKSVLNQVNSQIMLLPAMERAVINLRIHEELSYKEIGEILFISAEAARKRFDRAIIHLRKIMSSKLATLPLLYTAIYQSIKQNMPKNTLPPSFSNLEKSSNILKNLLSNPIAQKAIPIITIGLVAAGAGTAYVVSTNNANKSSNNNNSIVQVTPSNGASPIPTDTPTPTDAPTPTPTVTPSDGATPTPTVTQTLNPTSSQRLYRTYKDSIVSFVLPTEYTVTASDRDRIIDINGNELLIRDVSAATCPLADCSAIGTAEMPCGTQITLANGTKVYQGYFHYASSPNLHSYRFHIKCGSPVVIDKYGLYGNFPKKLTVQFTGPTANKYYDIAISIIKSIKTF